MELSGDRMVGGAITSDYFLELCFSRPQLEVESE
jgi:hypothetical protein